MSAPDIRLTMFLPPDDTLRVWDLRGELEPTTDWHEMMHEDHAAAFTVAKVAKLDLLRSIRQSLDDALRQGRTFEAWKADLVPELKKAGWWGVVTDKDITGADRTVIVNERRLQTIFQTNIAMSRAAARWAKIQREKHRFPYLRYRSNHWREDPRQLHKSWHGLILAVDDPWWQTHFPPNGWGCGCRVEQVTAARLDHEGWTVSKAPDDGSAREFHAAGRSEPIMVPPGIHPGFGYNPGTAHLRALADKVNRSADQALAAGNETGARRIIEELIADPAFSQFRKLPDQPFPVQVLTVDQASALKARAQIVRFSLDSLDKQERSHGDLTDAEYALLPQVIGAPDLIEPQGERKLALYRQVGTRWYRAVVKSTGKGDELFLPHFQYLRAEEMARLRTTRSFFGGWAALLAEWVGAR